MRMKPTSRIKSEEICLKASTIAVINSYLQTGGFMTCIFISAERADNSGPIQVLIVPHIDFRNGIEINNE